MTPRWITAAVTVAAAALAALAGAGAAGAAPVPHIPAAPDNYCPNALMFYNPGFCDPHLPDPAHDHCAGGRVGSLMSEGYCDGEPYPDGSHWRATQTGKSTVENPKGWMAMTRECVIGAGTDVQPAPPGGCDGAV